MTKRRQFLSVIILAVVGYAAISFLSPRFNPSAIWHYNLDRSTAITRARQEAARSGIDAANWNAAVTSSYQSQTGYFFYRYPESAKKAMLTPVLTMVKLAEPAGERRQLNIALRVDGALDSFTLRDASKTRDEGATRDESGAEKSPVPIEKTREAASAALARLVGSEAAQFSQVSELEQGKKGVQYVWERTIPGENDFKIQVTSLVRGEVVRELKLITWISPRFIDEYNSRRNFTRFFDLIGIFLWVLTLIVTATFYLIGWVRGEINHRLSLILLIALFILGIVRAFFTMAFDTQLANNYEADAGRLTFLGVVLSIAVPVFLFALIMMMLWSAGHALARRSGLRSSASFIALLKGRLLSKLTTSSIADGILLGGILGAVPLLIAASGLFPNLQLNQPDQSLFIARSPVIAALFQVPNLTLLAVYGFLFPFFGAYLGGRTRRAVPLLTLLIGAAMLLDETMYQSSAGGAIAVAALTILVADQIFRRFDFLTLMVAAQAAAVAYAAWTLLVQPSFALRGAGWRVLLALAVLAGAALVLSWRRREAEDETLVGEDVTTQSAALQKAERERLLAEFGVARRAQQHMLPAVPPRIFGYEIAATCRPAREVGGDLYDFLVLPNERVGIVVADVSGKGVPAALYMTLTKGLLASVAENESDPAAILREVNRHLYEVCRRKVFVTMLLGVLDPATQTFTYARAGHNVGIWRRVSQQASHLLRAPGLGLGLSKSKTFNKTLQTETIRVERGDALLLYSDGITEAMNAANDEYGEQRLLDTLARSDGRSAAETQEAILEDVGAFLGETPPQDDITIVVVRVAEG